MRDITIPQEITDISNEPNRVRKMVQFVENEIYNDDDYTCEQARTFRKTGWSMTTEAEVIPHIETFYNIV